MHITTLLAKKQKLDVLHVKQSEELTYMPNRPIPLIYRIPTYLIFASFPVCLNQTRVKQSHRYQ